MNQFGLTRNRLWMLKLTICEFFKRLTLNIWTTSHERMLNFIKWFLLATFIGVVVADLAECQPFTHYWQVVPDPGAMCRQGYAQLLMMGAADVFSDILLVVFPIPIIITSKMGITRKIQLVVLFAGSLVPAGITLYRIHGVIERDGSQQYRSLLASLELLFATAVANVLVLGSFVRDRGVKKQRWKFGSMSDSIERTTSRRGTVIRHWGSDEDLVRDMGISANPELRDELPAPRPAPMAAASQKVSCKDWDIDKSQASEESDIIGEVHSIQESNISSMSPRKVSFFDVGGLLDGDIDNSSTMWRGSSLKTLDTDAESSLRRTHSNYSNEMGLSPTPARRGSSALLQDIGGLLGPRRADRHSGTRGYELQTITQERSPHLAPVVTSSLSRQQTNHSLQDVGGLLG